MTVEAQRQFTVESRLAPTLFGQHDEHLHSLEQGLGIKAYSRGNVVHLLGTAAAVDQAMAVLSSLQGEVEREIGRAHV